MTKKAVANMILVLILILIVSIVTYGLISGLKDTIKKTFFPSNESIDSSHVTSTPRMLQALKDEILEADNNCYVIIKANQAIEFGLENKNNNFILSAVDPDTNTKYEEILPISSKRVISLFPAMRTNNEYNIVGTNIISSKFTVTKENSGTNIQFRIWKGPFRENTFFPLASTGYFVGSIGIMLIPGLGLVSTTAGLIGAFKQVPALSDYFDYKIKSLLFETIDIYSDYLVILRIQNAYGVLYPEDGINSENIKILYKDQEIFKCNSNEYENVLENIKNLNNTDSGIRSTAVLKSYITYANSITVDKDDSSKINYVNPNKITTQDDKIILKYELSEHNFEDTYTKIFEGEDYCNYLKTCTLFKFGIDEQKNCIRPAIDSYNRVMISSEILKKELFKYYIDFENLNNLINNNADIRKIVINCSLFKYQSKFYLIQSLKNSCYSTFESKIPNTKFYINFKRKDIDTTNIESLTNLNEPIPNNINDNNLKLYTISNIENIGQIESYYGVYQINIESINQNSYYLYAKYYGKNYNSSNNNIGIHNTSKISINKIILIRNKINNEIIGVINNDGSKINELKIMNQNIPKCTIPNEIYYINTNILNNNPNSEISDGTRTI